MALSRRQADHLAKKVFLFIWLIPVGMCFFAFYRQTRTWADDVRFASADHLQLADPAAAVRDARALIAQGGPVRLLEPGALPPALRIARLKYASVHEDHLNLVLARSPDTVIGARIWSARHRPHADQATRYRDVFFFRYTNDASLTAGNMP